MSAMLYTHTAEPRKIELRAGRKPMSVSLQMGLMRAGWTPNRPGRGKDRVDNRVFVVSGREQKNVL